MKVAFAPIDARDGIVGYDTVGFVDDDFHHQFPASSEMYLLQARMEAEYLTRLHVLQQEIAGKYGALSVNEQFTRDYEVRDNVAKPIWQAVDAQVEAEFPGERAEYYD
jgi:hypothetical protein